MMKIKAENYIVYHKKVIETEPLIHCITNYVTVNDVANAILAVGGNPVMSDAPEEITEITTQALGLYINIGTINSTNLEAMKIAAKTAALNGIPMVLDPAGVGASDFRYRGVKDIINICKPHVIRGNSSEIRCLAMGEKNHSGVDTLPADIITEENFSEEAQWIKKYSKETGSVIAVSSPVDIVTDGNICYGVKYGSPLMSRITGMGCMLTAIITAFIAANPSHVTESTLSAIILNGLAGEKSGKSCSGTGTFKVSYMDALSDTSLWKYQQNGEIIKL